MIALERDTIRPMRASQDQYPLGIKGNCLLNIFDLISNPPGASGSRHMPELILSGSSGFGRNVITNHPGKTSDDVCHQPFGKERELDSR